MTFVKDPQTGMVINTSASEYERFKQAREQVKKIKVTEAKAQQARAEVDGLKQKVDNIEKMLTKLMQHFNLE